MNTVHPAEHVATDAEICALLGRAAHLPPRERRRLEDEVARLCLPFVRRLVRPYEHRGAESDDLVAVGNCALAKAIHGFRPERGDFFAYAAATIRGDVKKHFRDFCWTVRPPRRVQELQARIARARADEPRLSTTRDVATAVDAAPADVREAMGLAGGFASTSIDRLVEEGQPLPPSLTLVQPEYELIDDLVTVGEACRALDAVDRELLRLRFGCDLSQSEIAGIVGVSQMQVSRRLRRVITTVRSHLHLPDVA